MHALLLEDYYVYKEYDAHNGNIMTWLRKKDT